MKVSQGTAASASVEISTIFAWHGACARGAGSGAVPGRSLLAIGLRGLGVVPLKEAQ
jgi:hypothetical protein